MPRRIGIPHQQRDPVRRQLHIVRAAAEQYVEALNVPEAEPDGAFFWASELNILTTRLFEMVKEREEKRERQDD